MALYLTYRPQTFDDVVRQEHIIKILKPKVLHNDYAHSNFLFYGPRGTGKTSMARIFAKAINCLEPKNGNPCNVCTNCVAINEGKTVDMVEIDAASHTGVDNVREEIIDKAPYPPSYLKKKVYIIDEVHMLSKPAFNALLKIMEEPPEYLVFILATTEIHKVPETILSRCQVFTFKKVPVPDLVKHLKMICEKEKFAYDADALTSIAKISDGCVRDAVKYVDQVSILGDITQEHVSGFLGVASDTLIKGFFQACLARDIEDAFEVVGELQNSGIDIGNFIKQSLTYIEEHFQENPAGYILCADILKNVSYGLRSFPIPTVLLKMEIYKALADANTPLHVASGDTGKSSKSAPASTSASSASSSSSSSQSSSVASTAVSTSPSGEKVDNDSVASEEKSQVNTVKSEDNDVVSLKEGRGILDAIIANPEIKHTIKTMLTNSSVLEMTPEGGVLYVFNKLQGTLLQKAENWSVIEDAFKKATNSESGLQILIMSREEYLSKKL